MGWADQAFSLRIMAEKYMEKSKISKIGFMDLEKGYGRFDRNSMGMVIGQYEVHCRLLGTVKSLCDKTRFCVKVEGTKSVLFQVRVVLRQWYIMYPSLFNICMDGASREVKVRVMKREAALRMSG